jgi:hypothetical protein
LHEAGLFQLLKSLQYQLAVGRCSRFLFDDAHQIVDRPASIRAVPDYGRWLAQAVHFVTGFVVKNHLFRQVLCKYSTSS